MFIFSASKLLQYEVVVLTNEPHTFCQIAERCHTPPPHAGHFGHCTEKDVKTGIYRGPTVVSFHRKTTKTAKQNGTDYNKTCPYLCFLNDSEQRNTS